MLLKKIAAALAILIPILALTPAVALAGEDTVTLTAIAGAGGTVALSSIQVSKGARVDLNSVFKPAPSADGHFAHWTDEAGAPIADALVTADADMTVTAVFSVVIPDEEHPLGGDITVAAEDHAQTETDDGVTLLLSLFVIFISLLAYLQFSGHNRTTGIH